MRARAFFELLTSIGQWSRSRPRRSLSERQGTAPEAHESSICWPPTEPLLEVLDAIPQLVWISDGDGRLSYMNQSCAEYTGVGAEQVMATRWFDVLHPDDVEHCMHAWRDAVSSRGTGSYQAQVRLRRAVDGRCRWHLCRAAPYSDEGEHLQVWLGTFTDFEEVKRALQARDDAISAVSHDLRTPLTALKLRLDALLHQGASDPKSRERVESAITQALRLEKLIDDLLDFSHMLEGRISLAHERLELFECTSQLIERIRPAVIQRGASVELSCASPAHGYWDRARIEQVIASLLLSMAKRGTGHLIRIHVDSDDRLARLTVEDSGMGASTAVRGQALERDAGASASDLGKLEVGLYLAREIIIAHGGTIRVDSAPGRGTVYTVELPKKSVATMVHQGTL